MAYIAWIPILTPTIDFERRVRDFIEQNEEYIENKENLPDEIIYKREFDDVKINSEGEQKIKIKLDNFKIKEIYFNEIKLAEIHHISKEGVVWFSLTVTVDDEFIDQALAQQVYVVIKDVYHVHTHHHKEDDMLLVPCRISVNPDFKIDDSIALQVLNQYSEKIITYHKDIHNINENKRLKTMGTIKLLLLLFKKSMGEMVYGLHFLSLVKSSISGDLYNTYKKAFENSLTSMRNLRDNFNLQQNQTNISLFIFSIIFSIIGFCVPSKLVKILMPLIVLIIVTYYIFDSFILKKLNLLGKK